MIDIDIAECIGCGCDDLRACCNEAGGDPCSWLRVDALVGKGVCSSCPDHLARWDAGDISMSHVAREEG